MSQGVFSAAPILCSHESRALELARFSRRQPFIGPGGLINGHLTTIARAFCRVDKRVPLARLLRVEFHHWWISPVDMIDNGRGFLSFCTKQWN